MQGDEVVVEGITLSDVSAGALAYQVADRIFDAAGKEPFGIFLNNATAGDPVKVIRKGLLSFDSPDLSEHN